MRVADPAGQPVGILTMIGVSSLCPGSRCMLKLDFPMQQIQSSWVPCFQISACLQGEEFAIYKDGSRRRASVLLLDTAHQVVDPVCTECVCLDLILPHDAPCSMQTDLCEISTKCLVDITVGTTTGGAKYNNLRLEIPCNVVHAVQGSECEEDQEELPAGLAAVQAMHFELGDNQKNVFDTSDILEDLKGLSMDMAEQCGLRPSVHV